MYNKPRCHYLVTIECFDDSRIPDPRRTGKSGNLMGLQANGYCDCNDITKLPTDMWWLTGEDHLVHYVRPTGRRLEGDNCGILTSPDVCRGLFTSTHIASMLAQSDSNEFLSKEIQDHAWVRYQEDRRDTLRHWRGPSDMLVDSAHKTLGVKSQPVGLPPKRSGTIARFLNNWVDALYSAL